MTNDEQFMIECITTELTEYVMRDYHIGMKEALDMVYNSVTYSKLLNTNSGLYYQSPLLIYDIFKEEQVNNGKRNMKMANKRNSIHQISCKHPVPDSFLWIFYHQNCIKYEKRQYAFRKDSRIYQSSSANNKSSLKSPLSYPAK